MSLLRLWKQTDNYRFNFCFSCIFGFSNWLHLFYSLKPIYLERAWKNTPGPKVSSTDNETRRRNRQNKQLILENFSCQVRAISKVKKVRNVVFRKNASIYDLYHFLSFKKHRWRWLHRFKRSKPRFRKFYDFLRHHTILEKYEKSVIPVVSDR